MVRCVKKCIELLLFNARQGVDYRSQLASLPPLNKIYMHSASTNLTADEAGNTISGLLSSTKKFTHVLAGHSSFGKDVIPWLAGKLEVQPITDIIAINVLHGFV